MASFQLNTLVHMRVTQEIAGFPSLSTKRNTKFTIGFSPAFVIVLTALCLAVVSAINKEQEDSCSLRAQLEKARKGR